MALRTLALQKNPACFEDAAHFEKASFISETNSNLSFKD